MALVQLPVSTVRMISSSQIISSMSSVIKELMENAIDAGASYIDVKLDKSGLDRIEVADNGSGISRENAPRVCLPSHTSKICDMSDLERLQSYGFRGEALSALCAVSKVTIITRTEDDDLAMAYSYDNNGQMTESRLAHRVKGTVVCATGIFKSLPVRKQMMSSGKRAQEELKNIEQTVKSLAIIHPKLRVTLAHNKCLIWQKSSVTNLKLSFMQIVSYSIVKNMDFIFYEDKELVLEMLVPKFDSEIVDMCQTTSNRVFYFYVNSRPVRDTKLEKLVIDEFREYFGTFLPHNKYPYCLISLKMDPATLDVNLEPNKTKILFNDQEYVMKVIKSQFLKYYSCSDKPIKSQIEGSAEKPLSKKKVLTDDELTEAPKSKKPKTDHNFESQDSGIVITQSDDLIKSSESYLGDKTSEEINTDSVIDRYESTKTDNNGFNMFEKVSDMADTGTPCNITDKHQSEFFSKELTPLSTVSNENVNHTNQNFPQRTEISQNLQTHQSFNDCPAFNVEIFDKSPCPTLASQSFEDENHLSTSNHSHIDSDSNFFSKKSESKDSNLANSKEQTAAYEKNRNNSSDVEKNKSIDKFLEGVFSPEKRYDFPDEKKENVDKVLSGFPSVELSDSSNSSQGEDFCKFEKGVENELSHCIRNDEEDNDEKLHHFLKSIDEQSFCEVEGVNAKSDSSQLNCEITEPTVGNSLKEETFDSSEVTASQWSKGQVFIENKLLQGPAVLTERNDNQQKVAPNLPVSKSSVPKPSGGDKINALERSVSSQMGLKQFAGFTNFAREIRSELNEKKSFTEVARELTTRWRGLPENEQETYNEKAKQTKIDKPANFKQNESMHKKDGSAKKNKPINEKPWLKYERKIKKRVDTSVESIRHSLRYSCSNNRNEDSISLFCRLETPKDASNTWVCQENNAIGLLNILRLHEVVGFHKLLEIMEMPLKSLGENIVFTESDLGNYLWSILMSLESCTYEDDGWKVREIIDPRIKYNGFNILIKDINGVESALITSVAQNISYYGLNELKETLQLISRSEKLSECRPTKVKFFIKGEVVRIRETTKPENSSKEEVLELIDYWLKHIQPTDDKCLHGKPILCPIHELQN